MNFAFEAFDFFGYINFSCLCIEIAFVISELMQLSYFYCVIFSNDKNVTFGLLDLKKVKHIVSFNKEKRHNRFTHCDIRFVKRHIMLVYFWKKNILCHFLNKSATIGPLYVTFNLFYLKRTNKCHNMLRYRGALMRKRHVMLNVRLRFVKRVPQ